MALRLHGWNRRILSLGLGMLFCGAVGCTTTKDNDKPLTNQVSKTTMGPGNTVGGLQEPLTTANPANGSAVVRNSATVSSAYSNMQPVMPNMPTNANPQYVPQLSTQLNTNGNPASFSQPPVQPLPANNFNAPNNNGANQASINNNVVSPYPPVQPTGGQLMVPPTMAPQPPVIPAPQQSAQMSPQVLAPAQNQMKDVQIPSQYSAQTTPAQVPPYVSVPMSPASQNNSYQQMQGRTPTPQQAVNQSQLASPPPTMQAQSPQQYTPTPPIQSVVPIQLQQAPSFSPPISPGPQSSNQPSQAPNPSGNTAPGNYAASAAALDSGSMGMSAKAVASGQVKGVNDPSLNISEPVVTAPVTIPSVPK